MNRQTPLLGPAQQQVQILDRLTRRAGKNLLMVTHSPDVVGLADRVFRGDKILHGAVIDFIDFQWFPIFNIADMAIDIGGAIFVLWTIFGHRRNRAA